MWLKGSMTAVLVRYIWPLSAELLAPFTTLPGFRQTDWKMWTMTPCVLDQLERVLLRDYIKANYRIISNPNQNVFVYLAIVVVFYCIAKINKKYQSRKQVKNNIKYMIYQIH